MSLHDAAPKELATEQPGEQANPIGQLARIISQAARFAGDAHGLGNGERAALARLDPDDMRPHQVAALTRALIYAGLEPEHWQPETWNRWALIAHGMALAGHDGSHGLGQQLCTAGVAEARVTKLLTARGDAFRQFLPRLIRLLAAKEVAPNCVRPPSADHCTERSAVARDLCVRATSTLPLVPKLCLGTGSWKLRFPMPGIGSNDPCTLPSSCPEGITLIAWRSPLSYPEAELLHEYPSRAWVPGSEVKPKVPNAT